MFELFFLDIQQNFKLFLFAPILCAVFRAIFILKFNPHKSLAGHWKPIYHCFRYGFWWGMDFNAYVFLIPLVFISLPGAFFPEWLEYGDRMRIVGLDIYLAILYTAFIGKLIFYYHYHDIYNHILWLGKNAEKHNLADVFFNEHHGMWLLLSYIPYLVVCTFIVQGLLGWPTIPYPLIASAVLRDGFNSFVVLAAAAIFYYCRYGGTFMHDDKPEWDTIPSIVKRDIFFARATVDDLVALKNVYHHPMQEMLVHTDEEDIVSIDKVIPEGVGDWQKMQSPIEAFKRTAQGARIKKPRHIFLIVGESYAQIAFDKLYADFHLVDGGKAFRQSPHTAVLDNFLPAGMISRPAIVSLMAGIFDAQLELNEREDFWHGTVPTALPLQLKKLGYESIYWYGGNATYGNFNQFAPAVGFDKVMAATEFCPPDSPKTWVGVYDHIFMETMAEKIKEMKSDKPIFHYIYTTSNHGPYKMPLKKLGFDTEKVMPDAPEKAKKDAAVQKCMGTCWYSDQSISKFVKDMQETYPDSLIFVTGDHAAGPIPFDSGIVNRRGALFREQWCTSFAMYHKDIDQSIFAGNTIGGHMNIMPTIMELIAPKGHSYYSMFPSLLEPIDHVVTPYHWLTPDAIGLHTDTFYQGLDISSEEIPTMIGENRFMDEMKGYCDITGWFARHTDELQPVGKK